MFEEQYRRDNERLHAPADALERIRERAERPRAPRHAAWTRYAAAAAALLLVCGGAAGVLLRGRGAADGAALPQVASAAAPAGGGAQDALERSGDGYAAETEEAAQADAGALLYAAADGLYAPEDHAELYALIGQARADAAEAAELAAAAAENGLPASAPDSCRRATPSFTMMGRPPRSPGPSGIQEQARESVIIIIWSVSLFLNTVLSMSAQRWMVSQMISILISLSSRPEPTRPISRWCWGDIWLQ